uniref:Uncharacterized protein LOC104246970 n=1 Tax=Nicotiana sylvestris TaxID=4096 RepID=A0A1U7YAP4_NICSY|nr:PREDICTED: uncharacterized protein LOC104246970 [Nicotiana sylvestris]
MINRSGEAEKIIFLSILIMRPTYRPPRHRGRGRASIDGRGNNILAQVGNQKLIAANIAGDNIDHPLYKNFMDFIQSRKDEGTSSNVPTYSSVISEKINENLEVYNQKDTKELIILLEQSELKWKDNPWQLMAMYFDTSYTTHAYKYRMHYEIILSTTRSAEIQHFYPANTRKIYSFSKIIIKKVPNWFFKWWKLYGPSLEILSPMFKSLYTQWVDISPKINSLQKDNIFYNGISAMYFFIEFSIPWIMKWDVQTGYTEEGIPCLQRIVYNKFWTKLAHPDHQGKIYGEDLINQIKSKIEEYKDQEVTNIDEGELSPFQQVIRKLQMKKGAISKKEIIASYFEEIKKDLAKNFETEIGDDISMTSIGNTSDEEVCAAGEAQRNSST